MPTSSNRGQRGKWAEAQVQGWLDKRSDSDRDFAWNRYPDARSARGALSAQPSDFLVAWKGSGHFHLEAKETANERRLSKDKISQYGRLKKFWWAGTEPVIVVYITTTQEWTYLLADNLFNHEVCPPSFKLVMDRTKDLDELMTRFFGPIRVRDI